MFVKTLLRVLLCMAILSCWQTGVHAQEKYVQTITGRLKANDSCRTIDPVYADAATWAKRETDLSVKNIITFELRQDTGIYYYGRPFHTTLKFDVHYEDKDHAAHDLNGLELSVAYDTTAGSIYKGVAMYYFEGGYNVRVKINKISSPELGGQDSLPAVFRVKNEIFLERKFFFSTANSDITRYALENSGHQVRINWMVNYDYPGAEYYDLEWTFYEDSSIVGKTLAQATLSQAEMEMAFRNNSSRITTTAKEYLLNNPYPSGYILYRVRGARDNNLTGEREEGDWTYKAYGTDGAEGQSIIRLNEDHAAGMNYQFIGQYAEEGKHRDVITYFDGNLKSRQLVTLDNSKNRAVVQETIYDVMGRQGVVVAPSPEMDSSLHFFPRMTLNRQGIPYSYKDMAAEGDTCNVMPQAISDTSGAGRYYSANSPFTNDFFHKYVADAGGYPFSATVYTPDNTGRVRETGNMGETLQPGRGHTTRYYYSSPDAVELDRLFGSEAGNAAHYAKNFLLDQNGQITVTYIDVRGNMVASAMAGPKPANLYALPGATDNVTKVSKDLAKPENTTRDAGAFTITSSNTLVIPMAGDYHFNYSFDPQTVTTASCEDNPRDICADCYYDLLIQIVDECGTAIHTVNLPAALGGIDTSCATTAPKISGNFDLTLPIGEYQVTYQLRASKAAAEYYDSAYLKQNTCVSTLDQFKRNFIAKTDFSGCYNDCSTCKAALGTKESFTDKYLAMLKAEDMYPDDNDKVFAGNLYDSLYYNCANKCTDYLQGNPCDETYQLLLSDVSPGGQYALYDENMALEEDTINVLRYYNAVSDYVDGDGNAAMVQNDAGEMVTPQSLSLSEFIQRFEPSWAASLVKYHPEYCFYKWCGMISESKKFDELLTLTEDPAIAADSGWWNRNDAYALLNKDPFFATGGAGASQYATMKSTLQHYSKKIQTNMQAGDVDIMQVIKYLVYCAGDSTISSFAQCTGPLDCNGGLDENLEWLLYKNFYAQEKVKLVALARQNSSDPVIKNCKNCYIGYAITECDPLTNPDCNTYQQLGSVMTICKDYYANGDPRKALYASKTRQYMDDVSGDNISTQLTSKSMQELRDSLDGQLNAQVAQACQQNCEAQADSWMASLENCENLVDGTDSTKYNALRQGLIEVCKKGCDLTHPYGASTIAPGTTNPDSSFEDVIIRVLGPQAVNDSCTALLISSPLPYGAQNDNNVTATGFDACTCENLAALQAEYAQKGGGGGLLAFMKKKYGTGFRMTQADLDIVLKKCGGTECVPASLLPTTLPDALRCKYCITCDSITKLIDTFKVAHPNAGETLLTNYLNQTLHFNLTYAEYWDFISHCATSVPESNSSDIPCADFTAAYNHFQLFKPDYYANPNGDTTIVTRFRQNLATWLNIELGRNLSYTAYMDAASRCGIKIVEPKDSLPIVCNNRLTPGDSVFACPVSALNCCNMDGYVTTFRNAYPDGVNARLVAYYFEMKRQQWCSPIGVPVVSYRESYNSLKSFFVDSLRFPSSTIIDVTVDGTYISQTGAISCGLDYNFGPALPLVDAENYRLCNHSPVIEVEIDSLACLRSQLNLALINAGIAYQEYIDSVRDNYQEIYLSRCMSVQPRLSMTGDLYEYHYTLYYYDQSGLLVKTIPPAGVQLLNAEQIAQVEHDRPYNKPECYDVSDTLSFNNGGYIPMNTLLSNRLSSGFSVENWISAKDYSGNQPLFSEEVTVSAPERYIDSTRTIPAFNGTRGISCFVKNNHLYLRIGRKPAYYPDTLYQTLTGYSTAAISSFLQVDKWAHVVVNTTGSGLQPFQVYINGKAVAFTFTSRIDTLGSAPVADGTEEFRLGAALIDNGWKYYNGYMKQFRFYNRILRYPEVVLNRDNTCMMPANEGGLLIWTPMNEGRDTSRVTDRIQNYEMATVNPSGLSWMRHHDPVYPLHTMATTYQYNSAGNIVQEYTPDADTTKYWFDRLGRQVAMQTAEQRDPLNGGERDRYGYLKYDSLSQLIETGEKTGASIANVNSLHNAEVDAWLNAGTNKEIIRKVYDGALPGLNIAQTNLRKRLASVTQDVDGDGKYETATHFSYDIIGNVQTLWQDMKALDSVMPGQGMKRLDYDYDLMSGNVNKVIYQQGKMDQFYYRYLYDAENKVIEAASSVDGLVWQRDVAYKYYLHGNVARMELGQYQVQGLDYAYTLQGWDKGLNSVGLNAEQDMAGDGKKGTAFEYFGRDVIGFSLGYYNNDYKPVIASSSFDNKYAYPSTLDVGNELFNGNISHTSMALLPLDSGAVKGYAYAYDQANRLVQVRQHNVNNSWNAHDAYKEALSYDANGNIRTYLRNGTADKLAMDNLVYGYKPGTNQLMQVKDDVDKDNYQEDLDNQEDNNYTYDRNGRLVKDNWGGIQKIDWNVNSRIVQITKDTSTIRFGYDASGNRLWKDAGGKKEFYVRDVKGNVMGTYNFADNRLVWAEQNLYGTGRVGVWKPEVELTGDTTIPEQDSLMRGERFYELTNHLGNVMATISDKKIGISADTQTVDYFVPEVTSAQDYYSYGMMQPDRSVTLRGPYRYGFNGMEKDNEIAGDGDNYATTFREYDARVGRWFSIDPEFRKLPSQSPYVAFDDNPIVNSDPNGDDTGDPAKLKKAIANAVAYILADDETDKAKGQPAKCNFGTNYVFVALTGKDNLNYKNANAMYNYLAGASEFEKITDLTTIQDAANKGDLIIATWSNPTGESGHVVVVAPADGAVGDAGTWTTEPGNKQGGAAVFGYEEEVVGKKTIKKSKLPFVMDTGSGKRRVHKGINYSYGEDKQPDVLFYRYTGEFLDEIITPTDAQVQGAIYGNQAGKGSKTKAATPATAAKPAAEAKAKAAAKAGPKASPKPALKTTNAAEMEVFFDIPKGLKQPVNGRIITPWAGKRRRPPSFEE
ncbi:LamG-like jellyroll fold domain-containing protein [Chitinophaga sp.]|uniref:RHS repeat domain-containing protein n=1 Tax=Chitinophaga sp. TaxID=1869181 RepID=UPI0031DD3660